MRSPARHRSHAHGFTLIELSIVVAIVGILATMAVVGYRRMIVSSHTAEATGMVNAIRIAEESVHAETGLYASPSAGAIPWPTSAGTGVTGDICPLATPTNAKTGWNPTCGSGSKWSVLPVHVDGPVMYGYWAVSSTTVSGSTLTTPSTINGTAFSATSTTGEWYSVSAVGDPDGNGKFSSVFGCSVTNDLFVQNEGD